MNEQDLVYRLRKRAEIRRQIQSRKSVQEGKPDRISDILEEAADEIERLHELVSGGLRQRLVKMNLFSEQDIADIIGARKSEKPKGASLCLTPGGKSLSDIARTGIAGAEFDPTNPDKKALTDVLPKFAKFSPNFMAEGRGDQEQAAPKLQAETTSNWEGMTCPACGAAKLVHGTRDASYSYKGQSTILPALTGDYCLVCPAIFLDLDETRRAMELTLEFNNKIDGK